MITLFLFTICALLLGIFSILVIRFDAQAFQSPYIRHWYKVPGRHVFCQTFFIWVRSVIWCHLICRVMGLFRRRSSILTLAIGALMLALLAGCGTPSLQPGGAYSGSTITTNSDGTFTTNVISAPMPGLYDADAAYKTAYDLVDGAFKYEYNNRAALQAVSPAIKTTLDKMRPTVWQIEKSWAAARKAYAANPTPAGLTTMQSIISQIQSLVGSAQAAVATATVPSLSTTNSTPTH